MEKKKVIVSRKWKKPEITITVTDAEIKSEMDFLPFLNSIIEEMGSPTFVMTKSQLFFKLQEAAVTVFNEMKIATKHI